MKEGVFMAVTTHQTEYQSMTKYPIRKAQIEMWLEILMTITVLKRSQVILPVCQVTESLSRHKNFLFKVKGN